MKNNRDKFIFGDEEFGGTPAVEVDAILYQITYEQLEILAGEFYGKMIESELVAAGVDNEMPDAKWIVAFPPNPEKTDDVFACRKGFIFALMSFKKPAI